MSNIFLCKYWTLFSQQPNIYEQVFISKNMVLSPGKSHILINHPNFNLFYAGIWISYIIVITLCFDFVSVYTLSFDWLTHKHKAADTLSECLDICMRYTDYIWDIFNMCFSIYEDLEIWLWILILQKFAIIKWSFMGFKQTIFTVHQDISLSFLEAITSFFTNDSSKFREDKIFEHFNFHHPQ